MLARRFNAGPPRHPSRVAAATIEFSRRCRGKDAAALLFDHYPSFKLTAKTRCLWASDA